MGHEPLRFFPPLRPRMPDFAQYSWWPVCRDALQKTDLEDAEQKFALAEEATLLRLLDPDVSIGERSALREAIAKLKQHRDELKKT
jgi:hypothetical protein